MNHTKWSTLKNKPAIDSLHFESCLWLPRQYQTNGFCRPFMVSWAGSCILVEDILCYLSLDELWGWGQASEPRTWPVDFCRFISQTHRVVCWSPSFLLITFVDLNNKNHDWTLWYLLGRTDLLCWAALPQPHASLPFTWYWSVAPQLNGLVQ